MFPSRMISTVGGDKFRDDYSLEFDGSNDTLRLFPHYSWGTSKSICFWCKPYQVDNYRSFFGSKTTAGYARMTQNNESTSLQIESDGCSTAVGMSDSSTIMVVNKWTHVTFVWGSDDKVSLYIDGKFIAKMSSALVGSSMTVEHIGYGYSSYPFYGKMADFACYDVALTANQIATIYNSREPYNHKEGVAASSLARWYRMGDGGWFDRKHLLIRNECSSFSMSTPIVTDLFTSSEGGADGWEDYYGTVARSTTISSYEGAAGVLKCTVADANDSITDDDKWLGKCAAISMEAKFYLAEAYIYIPSSWSGDQPIYLDPGNHFTEVDGFRNKTDVTIKDTWQYTSNLFESTETSGTGRIHLRAQSENSMVKNDFVYLDNFTVKNITNTGAAFATHNITTSITSGDTP